MKAISIWQPYASLLVSGHKTIECRTWSAPKSLIGQTIAIAATKSLKPEQRVAFLDPGFQRYYRLTDLPVLELLPLGAVIGTARLVSSMPSLNVMVNDKERAFGRYDADYHAWLFTDFQRFDQPVLVTGRQGIWNFD